MNRCRNARESLICLWVAAGIILIAGGETKADFAFGTPTNLGPTVNSSSWDNDPVVSPDGLSLFFDSSRPGGYGGFDVWVTTRETVQDPWGPPVNLGPPINSVADEASGGLSPDGLEFYFTSNRPGGWGSYDIWVTTRTTIQDPWGDPVNLGSTVNSSAGDLGGTISTDGLEFYFNSNRPGGSGGYDIWVTTRATIQNAWRDPVNLGSSVNSAGWDYSPAPSSDGLKLFFSSNRAGKYGDWAIWVTGRATRDDDWGAPINLGPAVNSSPEQENPCISVDGSTLYFGSTRPGGSGSVDLWQVSINPVVDFNGDGKVDGTEVLALAEHWGKNKSLCDIGPTPLGDGVVDANDLRVLAGYIGQEVNDPSLIAHWALDETTGMTAADSAGGKDALVMGNAAWQPTGGKLGGALAFDGKDDFATTTKPVLDPAQGPFSVIAWVKGGGASRVIVSQASGVDWLYLNQFGMLTTDLKSSGKDGTTLTSDAYVLDDQWHRVVLTWDGANRALYMDDVEVARDTQTDLKASSGKLLLGVGKTMTPASFWSGLIDEVRIYNRVVSP